MANATRSPRKDAPPSGTLLEELAREVFALRSDLVVMQKELTDLREQLAAEVRTRRLVVVNEDGFVGITGDVYSQYAEVRVLCPTEDDRGELAATSAVLHSSWEDFERAGVFLSGAGEIVGTFNAARQPDDLPNGDPCFDTSLSVHQRTALPGMTLDSDGLHLEPMRLHREKRAWIEVQKAAGRIPEDYDPFST